MPKQINISLRRTKQFKRLYEYGESTHSIAKKFGISHNTVLRHLRNQRVKIRSRSEAAKVGVRKGRIKINRHIISDLSKKLTSEKAYILGVLCGDGWIYYNPSKRAYQIGLETIDKEFAKKFMESLYIVYNIRPTFKKRIVKTPNWSDKYAVKLCSKAVCNDLLRYTPFYVDKWNVPKDIKKASTDIQAKYLKGFFDSEGNVEPKARRVGATSSNIVSLKEIQSLLQNFGIRSKLQSSTNQNLHHLRIQDRQSVESFNKNIGFVIKRKKDNLKQLVNTYKRMKTLAKTVKMLEPQMRQLRKKGVTYDEIGRRLNINAKTVWNHINKSNKLITEESRSLEKWQFKLIEKDV